MTEFLIVFAISYVIHAMGITIGYHRLLSHRSFCCPKWVEYFWVFMGYLAFEGSPIWWATIHRAHHRHVDTPLDPHSPREGLYNAHFGWLTAKTYAPHVNPAIQSKDLVSDPLYRFLEQDGVFWRAHTMGFVVALGFRALLWAFFGWQVALASLLAGLAVLQIPLMLNVVCHIPKLGYKNFRSEDDSVNVWWVGLLAMGEGWHNNHHVFPGSARSGIKPLEFDFSWHVIRLMRKLGWAYRVNDPTEAQLRAKMLASGINTSGRKSKALASMPERPVLSAGTMAQSTRMQRPTSAAGKR